MTTRPVLTSVKFVLVATLLCLAAASPAIFGQLPDESAALLVPLAQLSPLVAAIGFFCVRRRDGFVATFALRWAGSWPAIGIGVLTVALIGVLQLAASLLTGAEVEAVDAIAPAAVAVVPVLLLQSVFAIGEEFGWRGWLVTQLQQQTFWLIAGFSALAWVIWHLPALPLIVGDGGWEAGAAYLLAIASWSPFMVAVRLWSGSVWPAVIVHGALNSIRVFLTQSVVDADGVNWYVEIIGALLWLAAAAALHARTRGVKVQLAANRHARMVESGANPGSP